MTPEQVLKAKTPKTAARRLASYLRETWPEAASEIQLWTPDDSQRRGRGKYWIVCWESGPYDWAAISLGSAITAGEFMDYSAPGPFPSGLITDQWYVEMVNSYMLIFYKV